MSLYLTAKPSIARMRSSLTMRSIIIIVVCILALTSTSTSLATTHVESHAEQHSDNETKEETRSGLCDALGVTALGMHSGAIPDSAISSSSSYNELSTGSKLARLRQDKGGGAWCPHTQVNADNIGQEWVEVDLTDRYVVTGVATQGRYGGGMGVEFVEEFYIEYSRDNGSHWRRWRASDDNDNHLLEGNVDTNSVVEHELDVPIVGANRIRLYPHSKHLRTVCIRFELYGCLYKGPVSYSMPNGVKDSRFGNLMDKTYDGVMSSSGYLSGGVGQLVDGIKGLDNYKINRGFEWNGWQNPNQTIEMVFDFESVHNFTTASIYCQNSFTKNVRVFSSALIWFSIDGIKWSNVPIKYTYQSDNTLERPRDVIIHMQYRIGRFVKMMFRLGAQWLHISEISFDSQSLVNTSANISHLFDSDDIFGFNSSLSLNTKPLSPMPTQDLDQMAMKYSLLIITLVTLGFVILMVISSFMMKAYQNRKGGVFREISDTDLESDNMTVNMKDIPKITSPQTLLYCQPKDLSANEDEAEYAVPDVICANGKVKSLQMPSSKTIKTNPRYYASSEIIKSNHNSIDNKYQKQVLNHYESANYSQQTPLLTTFMANNHMPNQSERRNGSTEYQQIKRFNENDVFIFDKIGNSKFGDVWFAKISAKPQHPNRETVIVKSLNQIQLKQELFDEMKYLCQLNKSCDKFAKMFGVLDTSDYFGLVLEFGDCDLNQFLRECDPKVITYGTLVYMASEIARGCIYLESIGRTHGDLSARNILFFAKNLTVKISDYGSYRDKYRSDYFNGMPIRWMSPESIIDGRFSTKSDVFGFSTTFWEILTYCKSRPHSDLSDDTLLTIIINNTNDSLLLSRPHHCPKEIYDLMVECWQTNEDQRPPFHEIGLFLQRKNLGYQKPGAEV